MAVEGNWEFFICCIYITLDMASALLLIMIFMQALIVLDHHRSLGLHAITDLKNKKKYCT